MRKEQIIENLNHVRERIVTSCHANQRDVASVTLLAVSKTRPAGDLRAAYEAGQRDFGENYLQEALQKQDQMQDLPGIRWHFIGALQSNKSRAVAERFDWLHTVDRLKLARRLSEQRPAGMAPLNVCLQVNIDGEATKSGVLAAELPELARQVAALPNLALRGLMAIPAPRTEDRAEPHRRLTQLLEALRSQLPEAPLDTLSMGMSGDLEAAIEAGSTVVRVGTDIFGARD
ncbi:YggS family pyridoxal phosphate-dependent enzyme [Biformimicrobium ophioploci]|uniref:Pyridoxal phosphate homeostasis protein n=1 Tax=Biformimicrobium ophioploci TaxID=3036711 RepID=A0ABQ6LV38_9GAMM|nr:YggS family pyridoxal phosphate-dependent enzyme [Microbulbifer sp. NKW57]GMG85935.1 YggS family pyridoxal phosphate-dependent enzyme [Microbulbifer sp. NKW57]